MSAHPSNRIAARVGAAACVLLLGSGLLSACNTSDLLTVQAPSSIPAIEFEGNPTNALPIVNGAIADFECAFGAYAVLGGETGEELEDATQTAARYPYDRRNAQSTDTQYASSGCEALGVYTPLQTARATSNNARRLLTGWTDAQVPNRATLIARTLLYEAYSMLLLGEGFCTTTFTTYDGSGNPVYHPELTRAQAFTEAEARFTEALTAAQAAGATEIGNAARVGRARTRLDLGNKAGARDDAILVPAGFEFDVTADVANTRRQNRAYSQSNPSSSAVTVGAPYRNLNDPRVPVVDQGRKNVNQVPIWTQLKFPKPESPVALASYKEAQLIVAEADIATNPTNSVAIINAARGRGNQGPYLGALTPAALLLEVIDQRRRELYLESQHLGDLIRYNILPAPAAGTPYPGGGTYGTQLCLPLPDVERLNNPSLQ
jgi:hypothetical protein